MDVDKEEKNKNRLDITIKKNMLEIKPLGYVFNQGDIIQSEDKFFVILFKEFKPEVNYMLGELDMEKKNVWVGNMEFPMKNIWTNIPIFFMNKVTKVYDQSMVQTVGTCGVYFNLKSKMLEKKLATMQQVCFFSFP